LLPWAKLAELGWVGVDLFFVISGFLIAGILLDTRGGPHFYRNFYARRMLRIFPLYYLFVGVCLIAFPLTQSGSYFATPFMRSAGSPLWYLFYLGNVPEAIGHEPPYVLGPIWSLAIEEQFYIVFPFLVATLDRAKLQKLLLGLIISAPLFRLMALILAPGNERIQYLATPCRMDCIAFGCLLAFLLRGTSTLRARFTRRSTAWALGLGLLACASAFPFGVLTRSTACGRVVGYSLIAATFAALVAFVLARRDAQSTAFLRWAPLRYAGKISYGIYLLHRPADVFVDKVLARLDLLDASTAGIAGSVGSIALKFGVAIAFASASWYVFEKPLLRLKDRFHATNHPADGALPAGAGPARSVSIVPDRAILSE